MQTQTEDATDALERDALKAIRAAGGPMTLEGLYERLRCETMAQKHRLRLMMTGLARKDRLRINDDGTYDLPERAATEPSDGPVARVQAAPEDDESDGDDDDDVDSDEDDGDEEDDEADDDGDETDEPDDDAGRIDASSEPETPLPEFLERELWGSSGPVHRKALAAKATAAGYDVTPKTVGLMLTRLAADGKIRAGSRAGTFLALSEAEPTAPTATARAPRGKRGDPLGDYLKAELAREGTMVGSALADRAVAAGHSKSVASVGIKLGHLTRDGEIARPKRGTYAPLVSDQSSRPAIAGHWHRFDERPLNVPKDEIWIDPPSKDETERAKKSAEAHGDEVAKKKRAPKKKATKRKAKAKKPAPKPPKPKSTLTRRAESLEAFHARTTGRVAKLEAKRVHLREKRKALDGRIDEVERELQEARVAAAEAIGMANVARRFDKFL